ncbi:spermatogenesis-associated serine-rich protein 1 [Arapaima gigas]
MDRGGEDTALQRNRGQRRHYTLHSFQKTLWAAEEPMKTCGRRHFPPGHGEESCFRPHIGHIEPKLTVSDLDWKSGLRWLPEPRYSDAPHPHIKAILFPESTRLLRFFPQANMRSQSEWTFYPNYGQSTVFHIGKRCMFDGGLHYRSLKSSSEAKMEPLITRKRQTQCVNCLANAGKPYLNPEYSPDFHKFGCTAFGSLGPPKADTFIPLFPVVAPIRNSYKEKRKVKEREEEILEVRKLNEWRPAAPLFQSSFQDEVRKQ